MVRIKRFQIGLNVLIQLAIVAGLVVMVNYLAYNHFKRWDFSRNQKYVLSDQTKQLLANLKKPVTAVIFFNPGMEITADVMALLREYEYAAKKKLTTEIVDPYRNFSRARELQAKYKFGANENVLILDYDGRSKFVNAQDMAEVDSSGAMFGQPPQVKAFKGEQAITSALLEIAEEKQNKIYVLAGHGEPELTSAGAGGDTPRLSAFSTYVERQNIKAEPLNLSNVDKVPDDARLILITGPQYDLSEREIGLLRDYWQNNGRLLILLDASRPTPRLAAFLAENGIRPQGDRVLRTVRVGPQTVGILREVTAVVKGGSEATKRLEGIGMQFMGTTQSIFIDAAATKAAQITATPWIEAAEGFWGETDSASAEGSGPFFDPKKDNASPLAIAVGAEKGALSGVKVDTGRLVLVGNAEFLKDEALTESGLDFALGSINWLLNREDLIAVAPKERKTFTLNLSEEQIGNIALMVMGGIPAMVALLGFVQWWQRRS
ncbi:MAG TPA: GldG family protein [Fimbriimonadaceae bacterium]|nr:GldG family protein [Fimbriimonadaceae bacterium]